VIDFSGIDDPQSGEVFKSSTLLAHRDCVTGLAIGGGFLFSCSYDKTINIWSLEDFSHVQCLKGHEHKIMAIVAVSNGDRSLCISGDSGSGIFVWCVDSSLKEEPLKQWYEHNDWLYRGLHCLAVSRTGYLYTGSRDKSVKAWSLEDYTLRCTMTGHKSTVSCLAVASGILYSGSWDGTIRSWWLTDHTPLSALEDDVPGNIAPVLSISTEASFVVSSYENGYVKIWKNDVLVKSEKLQNGAIYAVKLSGKWLYSGGWDKAIDIRELLEDDSEVELRDVASITCDSIITSLLSWDERLIIGLSNRDIKVYCKGS
jgi:WD40 repeat protein